MNVSMGVRHLGAHGSLGLRRFGMRVRLYMCGRGCGLRDGGRCCVSVRLVASAWWWWLCIVVASTVVSVVIVVVSVVDVPVCVSMM